jgi:hypothetical protein
MPAVSVEVARSLPWGFAVSLGGGYTQHTPWGGIPTPGEMDPAYQTAQSISQAFRLQPPISVQHPPIPQAVLALLSDRPLQISGHARDSSLAATQARTLHSYLSHGPTEEADRILNAILEREGWAAFGFIGAEADLFHR